MKYLILLMTLILSNAFAADTVRLDLTTNPFPATAKTNINFILNTESPSGDGTSESAPARVYLPIRGDNIAGSGVPNVNFSTFTKSGVTSLLDITNASHTISVPFLLTIGGTAKYLYMAVRAGATGTSYYVSGWSNVTYTNLTKSSIPFIFTAKDICKSISYNNISTVCNSGGSFDPTAATATATLVKPMLYFFFSDQTIAIDGSTVIDPTNANYSGGIYFEAQMSNRIFNANSLIISITDIHKGDGRLSGSFAASTTMDTSIFNKVIAYIYNDNQTDITTNLPIGTATAGSISTQDISTAQSGDFTLRGLPNGNQIIFSLAFEDKFLFASTLSQSGKGTPTQIDELLKKQACYILTAGFGEEHYITNYFRSYRDHVLAHSWLGRKFIHLYYGTAPHYALIIYKSEKLRFMVRMFAYGLYFIFNYGWVVLIFFSSWFFLNFLRKNKILLQNNRL